MATLSAVLDDTLNTLTVALTGTRVMLNVISVHKVIKILPGAT